MLELWEMQSTPSLPSLPGLLWPGVVTSDRVLFYGSNRNVWHLNWLQTNDLYLIEIFKIDLFDHLTVCKQMTDV